MNDQRRTYLRTLGLIALGRREARKAALDRAHDLRKFEIELYWKRANYFWLLQGAVFAAVGISFNSNLTKEIDIFPLLLSTLGVLTALSGYLAALGSKFWQVNWEHHVDMLEAEFEGNLYKTVFVSHDGVRWSVTKINERLAAFFLIFWLIFLLIMSFYINDWDLDPAHLTFFINRTELGTLLTWLIVGSAWRIALWSGKPEGQKFGYEANEAFNSEIEDAMQNPSIKSYLIQRGQIR